MAMGGEVLPLATVIMEWRKWEIFCNGSP